ncbi:hypothetical protein ACYE2N_04320 [Flavobacterium sp. MAHUQ-51]|uniref:hypothetical protein n=1 Tax=Flavobacterium sp. GCM10022190 TaxID=3252639 RepID=UPI0036065485
MKLSSGLIQQFFEGDFPWVVSEKGLKAKTQALSKSINTDVEANKNGVVLYTGFIKILTYGKYNFSFQTSGKA